MSNLSNLEKLIAEDAKIKRAQGRLLVRKMRLEKKLQSHRGAVVAVDGEVYTITEATYPKIKYVGELTP